MRMEERICSAIWVETFFGLIGSNFMKIPGKKTEQRLGHVVAPLSVLW